jgi:hypothetical protein
MRTKAEIQCEMAFHSLGISDGYFRKDPEEGIHEMAHAYDCIGDKALSYVGNSKDVNDLVVAKFNDTNSIDANFHEIKVSAITRNVLKLLDIWTANYDKTIEENLFLNLSSSWQDRYSYHDTLEKYNELSESEEVTKAAQVLADFILSF